MEACGGYEVNKKRFTFQYGSTLIIIPRKYSSYLLFLFTFQYGSTLISISDFSLLENSLFTFQYGSTLI